MTIAEWMAKARRTIVSPCWSCGFEWERDGYAGYPLTFYCHRCCVSWAAEIPQMSEP